MIFLSFKIAKSPELGENYIRFPIGLQIVWGYADITTGSSGKTVAFPVAFSEIPRVLTTPINVDGGNIHTVSTVRNVTVSNFWAYVYDLALVYNCPRRFNWIAIGKWK